MKIKHFKAEKVHGYLSYDINFREDLTFLIGLNGSGKTTVLKLISGLLTPNYLYLAKIKFSKIELTLYDERNDNKICIINATQNEDNFQLFIDKDKIGEFPILSFKDKRIDDFRYESYLVEKNIKNFDDSNYAKKIKELIEPPIILGLNRLGTDFPKLETEEYYTYRPRYSDKIEKYKWLDLALRNIKKQLNKKALEYAQKKERLSNDLNVEVIKELVKPKDESSITKDFTKKMDPKKYLEELEKKINSINPHYLKTPSLSLRDSYDKILDNTNEIVDKLGKLKQSDKEFNTYSYALATSFYQLDILYEIASIAENFSKKIDEVETVFNRLKNSLNLFFAETNKEVDINGDGDLEIKIKDIGVSNNIYELSSGEKQLIILFSQLAFAQDSKNDIFLRLLL